MKPNEMNKYEFELLANTEAMLEIIQNRLVLTTDTAGDLALAYDALDGVQEGMFYLRHIKEGEDHVYFTNPHDRVRFIDAIAQL